MAKTKTEIHVTTVFDGELDAADVFVSLIAQKYGQNTGKEILVKTQDLGYNRDCLLYTSRLLKRSLFSSSTTSSLKCNSSIGVFSYLRLLMFNKAREFFTLPLYFIQVSRLHLQELID